MRNKWKWDKLFINAKKQYTKEDIDKVLKLHFQHSLIRHIESELFEYKIIKKHDSRTIGFFSFLASWIADDIYNGVKRVLQSEDKFENLCAWDIMTYNKIKLINKKRDKINNELRKKEFELLSGIDIDKIKKCKRRHK